MQRHAIFNIWHVVQFGLEHFAVNVWHMKAMDVHDKASVLRVLHCPDCVLSLLSLLNYNLVFDNPASTSFAIVLDIQNMFYILKQIYLAYATVRSHIHWLTLTCARI